jgi:ABC-type nitrate/sulfonate/bicarbonate transport system permease component
MKVFNIKRTKQQIEWKDLLTKIFQASLLPCLLIAVWDISVKTGLIPNTLIATPGQVAKQFLIMFGDGQLFVNSWASIVRLAVGFTVGTGLGITLGSLVGYSRTFARFVETSILTLIPVPPIAWIPLLIILFGIGDVSKISLISIGSFCTLFLQTAYSIRAVDRKLVEVGYVLAKNDLEMFFNILLPAAIPDILSSMRIAMALSWTLLMASEIIASSSGLGWLIWDSRNFSRPDDMIVGMISIGLLGKLTDSLLTIWGKYLTRWRATYENG